MGLIVLDSGVIIGVLTSADVHHTAATAALSMVTGDPHRTLMLPASGYAEVLVHPFRAPDAHAAVAKVDAYLRALPVAINPMTEQIAKQAARLRAQHRVLRLPDALVIATALDNGAERILTTDDRWPIIPGLSVEVIERSPPT